MMPTGPRSTVLVIDDDPEERAAMRGLLTDAGYDVVEASDGKNAMHYLTANLPEPALIVADLVMPDMSGWELITILQAYVRLAGIPVLVVSGADLDLFPIREEAVLEYFSKPLDAEKFLAAVKRHALTPAQRDARQHAALLHRDRLRF